MTDLATLGLAISSDGVVVANNRLKDFEGQAKRTETATGGMNKSFAMLKSAFLGLVASFGIRELVQMTSAWTDLNSRVNNAAGSIAKGSAVMMRLSEMARRTYSSLTQTAEGYLQNSQALTALGYSTQQQLDLVEVLNNSLVISATRGQAAQSVMMAWSKAMADGKLVGDNLNTIIQSGGRLSKALADSMGISVNQLREFGSKGKITADVMYGVTDQLRTLRDEAERMAATPVDGLVLINDAIFKFIGQADAAIGSSNALAEALVSIADAIERAPDETWFDRVFSDLGTDSAKTLNATYRELIAIGTALDYISNTSPGEALKDVIAFGEGDATRGIEDFELAVGAAEQALVNFAQNTKGQFGSLNPVVQDLIQQLLEGRGTAESATAAIAAINDAGGDFGGLLGSLSNIVSTLFSVRNAAIAANSAVANTTVDLGEFPSQRSFNKTFGPDLTTKPPKMPGGGGARGGASKGSKRDVYADMIRDSQQFIAEQELEVRALGMTEEATNRLRYEQEMLNKAANDNINLTGSQRQEIGALATAMAAAESATKKAKEAFDFAKDATKGFITDMRQALMNGASFWDAFGGAAMNVLDKIISKIEDQLVDALFSLGGAGSGSGGGFDIFGAIGKIFGFSEGGYTGNGAAHQAAGIVHGGEYVFSAKATSRIGVANLEAMHSSAKGYAGGGYVGTAPVMTPANGNMGGDIRITLDWAQGANGNIAPVVKGIANSTATNVVAQAAPAILGTARGQAAKDAPSAVARYQNDRAGGDYRVA